MARRLLLPVTLILAALAVVGYALWPPPAATSNVSIYISVGTETVTRQAVIEAPRRVWLGQVASVRLRVAPEGEESPDLSATLEAELEIEGVPDAGAAIRQAMTAGQAVTFSWEVVLPHEGVYPARLWLRVGPGDGTQLIMAAPLELRVAKLVGMSQAWAIATAVGLVVFAVLLGIKVMPR